MKKWLRKLWYNLRGDCQRCGTHEIVVMSHGMSPYDCDTFDHSYCPQCSTKDEEFLLLYDLLEKGIK